jgi:hypothetical protein
MGADRDLLLRRRRTRPPAGAEVSNRAFGIGALPEAAAVIAPAGVTQAFIEPTVYRAQYPAIRYPRLVPVDTAAPEWVPTR